MTPTVIPAILTATTPRADDVIELASALSQDVFFHVGAAEAAASPVAAAAAIYSPIALRLRDFKSAGSHWSHRAAHI